MAKHASDGTFQWVFVIGGADVAQDAAYLAIIREARRNPANADNDAAIQQCVMSTPGLSVSAVYTYPCILGPGTHAFAFLLSVPAGSDPALRVPNNAQITTALAWLTGQMPGDDSYFSLFISQDPKAFALRVAWDQAAPGWADAIQWPAYQTPGSGAVVVTTQTSATSFILGTDNANYAGAAQPQAGQTIGFWNKSLLVFSQKRIYAVSGTGPWTITTDSTVGDQAYSPIVGQRAFPWSDSLVDLIKPTLAYFNTMGPGEMFAPSTLPTDGRRLRRNPKPPKNSPQVIGTEAIVPFLALPSVQSAAMLENVGTNLGVGTPALNVHLITLDSISAFP